MECFGATDFDNNSRLITLSVIIISGLHCTLKHGTKKKIRYEIRRQENKGKEDTGSGVERRSNTMLENTVTSPAGFSNRRTMK
jgi:hypothetical protein